MKWRNRAESMVLLVSIALATLVSAAFAQDKKDKAEATAAIAVGAGAGASTMRNEKGVIIHVTGTAEGVDVRLALSGMTVKLNQ